MITSICTNGLIVPKRKKQLTWKKILIIIIIIDDDDKVFQLSKQFLVSYLQYNDLYVFFGFFSMQKEVADLKVIKKTRTVES